jgi:hypothetical protein
MATDGGDKKMNKEVSIIPYLFAMLLIIMHNLSESQTIKANVGKRNIYHDPGEVITQCKI